ncbi:phosphoglycerate dehydrogenase [Kocuria flava]|uniref:NAD(P)-dependent oxidoreductase n=1 Tax=Kocuria flava TaxID=446860 RepID=UPI001FF53E18|nr:NAD(P)-dependent oxidoreductase [Kocuria flava]MCJ8503473.1 phosphoglycerate dehydrogenase [Kocuria flava]
MKILIPDTADIAPADLPGHEVVRYDAQAPVPQEHADAQVLVDWGTPLDVLQETARRLTRVELVQALAAGPDAVLQAGFRREAVLCAGIGLHTLTVAEHALALMLHLVRQLPAAARSQEEHLWDQQLGGLQPLHPEGRLTTLLDARVLIWGFGAIGQHLAGLCTAMGGTVTGVARSAGERGGYPVVTPEQLPEQLPETDVLVLILPHDASTEHALNRERLDALPPHAFVVNVGRGSTVDEDALVEALTSGSIAGAAIDVASREPLPADAALWTAPNLTITPHMAGGRPIGGGELLRQNLEALAGGGEFTNRVERSGAPA